jgi:hypothetical protein
VSIYGDAIRALRQIILLDERAQQAAGDIERLTREVVDLRDRVSRIEGMLAAGAGAARGPRRLPRPERSDPSE